MSGKPAARTTAGGCRLAWTRSRGVLAALERRGGTGPETAGLDQQIAGVRAVEEAVVEAGDR
jgi:hypothetical protein